MARAMNKRRKEEAAAWRGSKRAYRKATSSTSAGGKKVTRKELRGIGKAARKAARKVVRRHVSRGRPNLSGARKRKVVAARVRQATRQKADT